MEKILIWRNLFLIFWDMKIFLVCNSFFLNLAFTMFAIANLSKSYLYKFIVHVIIRFRVHTSNWLHKYWTSWHFLFLIKKMRGNFGSWLPIFCLRIPSTKLLEGLSENCLKHSYRILVINLFLQWDKGWWNLRLR